VWHEFSPILKYAYPLAIMGFAGISSQMLDRILLQYWLPTGFYAGKTTTDAIGVYGACFKLTVFMSLAIQAFKYAAEPFFFGQAEDKNSPRLFAQVMHYFVITCVLFWLGISLNMFWLKNLFIQNPIYHEGLYIIPILLLANLILGIYYNLSFWFKLTDKTHYGIWLSILGAMITLVGNIALIPVMGYMACAWITLLAYTVMTWACYALGQKNYPVPYTTGKIVAHLILGSLIVTSSVQLPANWGLWLFFPNAGLLMVYIFFLYLTEKEMFAKLSNSLK
jgi:O-antigen/teichoic acid export membrane protein